MREFDLPRPLGPYTLRRRIALGGMAEIYFATVPSSEGYDREVAIKLIHPRFAEDPSFIRMLVNEARLSVQLTHVNIAQTFDLGELGGKYFIVMEFVEGADTHKILRALRRRKEYLPLDICAYVVSELCHGLDYAHRKRTPEGEELRIVHRDVSPQNVLISFAGEVKVADFGIAKGAQSTEQTEAGVIKGKYYYMSPEQAWADAVDARSDIYSAGLVLHELLTGEMAYDAENLPALLQVVREAKLEPPSHKRRDVPPELDEIVMRALQNSPEERYQSAQEFAQALSRFVYRTMPGFTSARLAALMAELFPTEREGSTSATVKLPEHERVLVPRFKEYDAPTTVDDRTKPDRSATQFTDDSTANEVPSSRSAFEENDLDQFDEMTIRAPPLFALSADLHADEHTVRSGEYSMDGEVRLDGPTKSPCPDGEAWEDESTTVDPRNVYTPPISIPSEGKGAPNPFANAMTSSEDSTQPKRSSRHRRVSLLLVAVFSAAAFAVWWTQSRAAPAASVEIVSVPAGARVLVDGREVEGTAPLILPQTVAGQRLTVEARLDGHASWRRTITVEEGTSRHIAVFVPLSVDMRVETTPVGANVEVNGELLGVTPVLLRDRTVGRRLRLRLQKAGFEPVVRELEVPEQPEPLHFELQRNR